MMNNLHYMVKTVEGSAELMLLGDDWQERHKARRPLPVQAPVMRSGACRACRSYRCSGLGMRLVYIAVHMAVKCRVCLTSAPQARGPETRSWRWCRIAWKSGARPTRLSAGGPLLHR